MRDATVFFQALAPLVANILTVVFEYSFARISPAGAQRLKRDASPISQRWRYFTSAFPLDGRISKPVVY